MIILALAAQLIAPTPIAQETWFKAGDVPVIDIRAEGHVVVGYGLIVTPDGTADKCFVDSSSGNRDIDRYVCARVLRNARFEPARNAAGQPTYGIYRDRVDWFSGAGEEPRPQPSGELDFTVARLPAAVREPASVRVTFATDSSGVPTACQPQVGSKLASLGQAACDQLVRGYRSLPALDAAGKPVPAVQSAVVRFFEG